MNDDTAEVYLYDEIGYWGILATDFVREINALDVSTIELRISSPGGSVFEGTSMHNALRRHPATVNVTVDGIAASIASVIAMAGDTVTMGRGTSLMVHDPSGVVLGQAGEMRKMADVLDKLAADIAGHYREKAGGTDTQWRKAMKSETWYRAQEAVDAGLADAVLGPRPATDRAPIAAQWRGRGSSEVAALLGEWSAWSADYTARLDKLMRSAGAGSRRGITPPDTRTVTVTDLADGRVRRDIGKGLTIITPRARGGRSRSTTSSRSDEIKERHGAATSRSVRSAEAVRRVRSTLARERVRQATAGRPASTTPRRRTAAELHALTLAARARQAARQAQQQRDLELRHLRGQSGHAVLTLR